MILLFLVVNVIFSYAIATAIQSLEGTSLKWGRIISISTKYEHTEMGISVSP